MPSAEYLLIGWGDEGFYRHGGFWRGVQAVVPPSPTVIHLIGAARPVPEVYRASHLQPVALSAAQAAGMAEYLADQTALNAEGAPIILSQGHAGPGSLFLRAQGDFHGLNMCNHWVVRALRAAGLDVGSAFSFRADGVLDSARRETPSRCPPA
jgi:hypothetical protein